ncbi:Acyltransferase [Burkholderia sp. 8Y]|uniref:acyltransferase family protein n=1 Tax=Burkholderia sp. 8Y TaxID=2653133 RepID=UPI0012F1FD25|nr:acyltransferase family protein [Burkholderia sp. 8Y]VXC85067.1 Acyltransferase [Burkholderia sp. 8Y]
MLLPRSPEQSHVSQTYRPDVDGLRAVAVIAVVLCHAGFSRFSGGFTGVDVFFAISGFVVTTSILSDLVRREFSFRTFYARRARRLAPALYLVLAATMAFSLLFSFPDDSFRLAKNVLAVATMTSNIYLSKQTGYFDAKAADQPLLHTWSLSVEEQFYVVLPVLLYSLHTKARRWLVPAVMLLAVGSMAWAIVASHKDLPGSYYFAQYRAFEFLAGSLLAFGEYGRNGKRRWYWDAVFALGLAIVLFGVFGFSATAQFPGLGALVPCGGAIATMFAGRRSTLADKLLSNGAAVYVGRISYPMYLWHWPIFFALRRFELASTTGYLAAIAVTVMLSVLTYRYVEGPARRSRTTIGRTLGAFLVLPIVASGVIAGTAKLSDGFLFAYPQKIRNDVHWSGDALFDMPRGKRCWSQIQVTDERACTVGDQTSRDKAILWGDSHAYHLILFFDRLGKDKHLAVHDVGFTLCPPIENEPPKPGDVSLLPDHLKCVDHDKAVMAYALSHPDVSTVFMAAAWQNYLNAATAPAAAPNGHGFMPGQLEAELTSTIGKLLASGKHVVLMDDVPMIPMNLINCNFNNDLLFPVRRHACQFDASIAREQHEPIQAMLKRLVKRFPEVNVMHTYDVPCSEETCALDFDGLPIYRYDDYHHLSAAGSSLLYDHYNRKHPGEAEAILGRAAR